MQKAYDLWHARRKMRHERGRVLDRLFRVALVVILILCVVKLAGKTQRYRATFEKSKGS